MAGKSLLRGAIHDYLSSVSLRESPILRQLREETASQPLARMQLAPEQAQFLTFLVQLIAARHTLEVGVFTGYSSLAVALALPPDGTILACDISAEYTEIARRYWKAAGVDHKIDLRIRPALETLQSLIDEGVRDHFDLALVDADKSNYENYYECALKLVRPGGLMIFDNVLWSGRVADPDNQEPDTVALRAFNTRLHTDPRISLSMLPLGDGFTLALKL